MVLSAEARAYKQYVFYVSRKRPMECNVKVEVEWFRARKSGDLDKRLGVLLDALQGVAFLNDSQVVEIHAWRFDTEPHGKIKVTVSPVA